MIFSSSFFIFAFLPIAIVGYYIMRPFRQLQNTWLVVISLFFYAWGEPKVIVLMLLSIAMNYLFGLWIEQKKENQPVVKAIIAVMLCCNLSTLFIFKYLNFTMGILGVDISAFGISLPLGISFYTFQAISYVLDVYRGNGKAQKNPLNVALYIAFFPQLIAGPIVRYETIADQILYRTESIDQFAEGIRRFITGLAKKLILANSFASIADYAFGHVGELSSASAWIGAICYTLQIYYDFSGYSDMAIGMGKMFGFTFQENFNYPYISKSVSEFWRRWHISLGSWFRDYVYIPLGGARVEKKRRLIFNLFVVWTLTGIWHGANWTFLLWGWGYFVILVFEKFTQVPQRMKSNIGIYGYYVFTLLCIIFGWVLFRADSVGRAFDYMKCMLFQGTTVVDDLSGFWIRDLYLILGIGVVLSTPIMNKILISIKSRLSEKITDSVSIIWYLVLFCVCISYCVNSSYNPFIYFNF